jgi:MFS family permease
MVEAAEDATRTASRNAADLAAQRHPPARQIAPLLAAVAVMVVGNGLGGTLVGLRAGLEGMPEAHIGLLMSAYFLGFALAPRVAPRWIWAIGHIRAFAAFASVASAVALAYPVLVSPWAWLILRFVNGACYAGLVVVVESWLNGSTTRRHRGRVLALYNVVLLTGWSGSQLLIDLADPADFVPFSIFSIFMSLSLVPVTLSGSGVPGMSHVARSSLRRLLEISPLGLAGVLTPGIAMGAFFGMGPTFAQGLGLDDGGVAIFMSVVLAGALAMQWPVGLLSDRVDRRLVLLGCAAHGAVTAVVLASTAGRVEGPSAPWGILLGAFMYGGATFPLYALAVAHVNDGIDAAELVPVASALVMVYGLGATIGPFAASLVMAEVGGPGLFGFAGAVLGVFVLFAALRLGRSEATDREAKQRFVATPRTSGVAAQLHEHRRGRMPGRRGPA